MLNIKKNYFILGRALLLRKCFLRSKIGHEKRVTYSKQKDLQELINLYMLMYVNVN